MNTILSHFQDCEWELMLRAKLCPVDGIENKVIFLRLFIHSCTLKYPAYYAIVCNKFYIRKYNILKSNTLY